MFKYHIKKLVVNILPSKYIKFIKSAIKVIVPKFILNDNAEDKIVENIKSTYIRTEKELKLRARGLREIRDILDDLKIQYFLSGGTLLGIIRDGDFIKWDFDVDINTSTMDIRPKQYVLISALEKAGFTLLKHYPDKVNFKIKVAKYGVGYDIVGFLIIGKNRYRGDSFYPNYICEEGSEVTLRGEKYKTFLLPNKYLEWYYGDWKTPIRNGQYITSQSNVSFKTLIFIKIVSWFC